MPSPPKIWPPKPKPWALWAIGISLGVHALIFLVRIYPWLPASRLPPSTRIVLFPGSEGRRAVEMRFQEPGGAAQRGRSTGITPRSEEPVPVPETPRPSEAQPIDTAVSVAPPVVAADTSGPRDTTRSRMYRIGPALGEGKLWIRPLPAPPRELAQALARTHVELVDSAVSAIVQAYVDSVLNAPSAPGAGPPSWTTQIFGKTFGIDSKYIYLGGLKIPSAILALLPIKGGGASMEYSQATRMAAIREDLAYAAQRSRTMEDFKQAVRELRAERERLKRLQENQRKKPEPKDTLPSRP